MRIRYFVTYDIAEDERRTKVFKALSGFGDHLQFSVFRCDLEDTAHARLIAELHPLIDHDDDQILMIDLGPVEGRARTCITAIGRRYRAAERTAVIV
jgi:CRISPR-associated protein Cas2